MWGVTGRCLIDGPVVVLCEGKALSRPLAGVVSGRDTALGESLCSLCSALVLNAFHNHILQREVKWPEITKK